MLLCQRCQGGLSNCVEASPSRCSRQGFQHLDPRGQEDAAGCYLAAEMRARMLKAETEEAVQKDSWLARQSVR